MKTTLLRLVLATAIVGSTAFCGGGGDGDKSYLFGGRWAATMVITASNVPGIPVGDAGGEIIVIGQNGTNVTVTYQSLAAALTMVGTCDPKARTFSAAGTDLSGIYHTIYGTGVDDDSMSGTFSMQLGPYIASGTWTANLASRAAGGGVSPGAMERLVGALAP